MLYHRIFDAGRAERVVATGDGEFEGPGFQANRALILIIRVQRGFRETSLRIARGLGGWIARMHCSRRAVFFQVSPRVRLYEVHTCTYMHVHVHVHVLEEWCGARLLSYLILDKR